MSKFERRHNATVVAHSGSNDVMGEDNGCVDPSRHPHVFTLHHIQSIATDELLIPIVLFLYVPLFHSRGLVNRTSTTEVDGKQL